MRIKQLLLISFLVFCSIGAFAQRGQDLQLADQYAADGEYEKAAELYRQIYDRTPNDYVYNAYLKCLLDMKNPEQAEKMVRKQIKKNPNEAAFLVDLGFVYASQGLMEKATEQYDKAVKSTGREQQELMRTAGRFIYFREVDRAIEVYKKGKENFRGSNSFAFELAELYAAKRDFSSMINEYFVALEESASYLTMIENNLQLRLNNDTDNKGYELLRQALLRKIQKGSDRGVFTELFLWYYIQQKDFENAFIQAKSLDMRNREDGNRIMDLADLALSNEQYNAAVLCAQYIIGKGDQHPYYMAARMKLLDAMNLKITRGVGFSMADILALEADYQKTLAELGRSYNTMPLYLGLAHLQAFYLGKAEQAQALLEEAVQIPGVKPSSMAECKLELADILLFRNDIWEATLLYSQVDKAFKEDPLGQEAKFRNARLSFYNGEFEWALAQLDVLKSATSQLIANDAIALSLIITDNTAFDTTTDALMLYAHADLLSYQNKDSSALVLLDSIQKTFPGHPLDDDALYKKYVIYKKQGKVDLCASTLQKVLIDYATGVLADDALYHLALLQETALNDPSKAMELYQKLLTNYPASSFVVDARRRYRALRGDQLN